PAYRKVVIKLSGEALGGPDGIGFHQTTVERVAADLVAAKRLGVALGIVVGGGNLVRGAQMTEVPRTTRDALGMLATVINALALGAAIEHAGARARTLSALAMPEICEGYTSHRAQEFLDEDGLVLLAGGTGNPYFTTDTTAVLRAAELGCDAVLKATNVD